MHMLKPTIISDTSLRDRHSFTSPAEFKHPNQENKSIINKTYTPYQQKYTQGIGLSLKRTENI